MKHRSRIPPGLVDRYHVTVLSNLASAYDKYSRRYSKKNLTRSAYPDCFYVLRRGELEIGCRKASGLLERLQLPGNRLVVLETAVDETELRPNERTGLGERIDRPFIRLNRLHYLDDARELSEVRIEEAMADSFAVCRSKRQNFEALKPRSVSILPVALGCQAACPFCFSKASVSADQDSGRFDPDRVREVFRSARQRGATRAVITGGGEPGLLSQQRLLTLIDIAREIYGKVVLISNGVKWARMSEDDRFAALRQLDCAGLSVLSLSRHHFDVDGNAAIMGMATGSEKIAATWRSHRASFKQLSLRWVCVLQKNGVDCPARLQAYLDWAGGTGVPEICFKELYVSTSTESEYHSYPANEWSHANQVSLSLVADAAREQEWSEQSRLPWGAPVFAANGRDVRLRIAAYTEPSLNWELEHGLCRSWNLMADGRCLASLEDRSSEVMRR